MKVLELSTNRLKVAMGLIAIALSATSFSIRRFDLAQTSIFEKVAFELFSPIQGGTRKVKLSLSNFWTHYLNIVDTSKENVRLKKELKLRNNTIFSLEQVKKENFRLKELLKFGAEVQYDKKLAQVIGWDTNRAFNVFRINKGSSDGVEENFPVITSGGLVGFVKRVSSNYADVLTILDSNNKVDVLNERSRVFGLTEGTGGVKLRMKYVLTKDEIHKDDVVVTAGLGKLYPKGIKVGIVESINVTEASLTQEIYVKPSVNFSKLEEVVVILKKIEDGSLISDETAIQEGEASESN